jgi:hypothetical protein
MDASYENGDTTRAAKHGVCDISRNDCEGSDAKQHGTEASRSER